MCSLSCTHAIYMFWHIISPCVVRCWDLSSFSKLLIIIPSFWRRYQIMLLPDCFKIAVYILRDISITDTGGEIQKHSQSVDMSKISFLTLLLTMWVTDLVFASFSNVFYVARWMLSKDLKNRRFGNASALSQHNSTLRVWIQYVQEYVMFSCSPPYKGTFCHRTPLPLPATQVVDYLEVVRKKPLYQTLHKVHPLQMHRLWMQAWCVILFLGV